MTTPVGLSRRSPVAVPAESVDVSPRQETTKAPSASATPGDAFGAVQSNKLVDLGSAPVEVDRLAGLDLGYGDSDVESFGPTTLNTTPEQAKAIAAGKHQIWEFEGDKLEANSQHVDMIESQTPYEPGQTHTMHKHVGQTLEDNIKRLKAQKKIPAAGGFNDLESAQYAVDKTIANPANQRFIEEFMADPGRSKEALYRVDLGKDVGTNTLRADLDKGKPCLRPASVAIVVLIKDSSFPEGYRVLTAYPEATRKAEVDANGEPL